MSAHVLLGYCSPYIFWIKYFVYYVLQIFFAIEWLAYFIFNRCPSKSRKFCHQFIFLICASLSQDIFTYHKHLQIFSCFLLKKLYFWGIYIYVYVPFQVKFHVLFFSPLGNLVISKSFIERTITYPPLIWVGIFVWNQIYILTMLMVNYTVHLYPGFILLHWSVCLVSYQTKPLSLVK